MTQDQIELRVELKMNRLDVRLMSGELSETEYGDAVQELNAWAELQYMQREQASIDWKRLWNHIDNHIHFELGENRMTEREARAKWSKTIALLRQINNQFQIVTPAEFAGMVEDSLPVLPETETETKRSIRVLAPIEDRPNVMVGGPIKI